MEESGLAIPYVRTEWRMNETIVALAPSESEPHCCYVFTDSGTLWELRTDVRSQSLIYALDKEELAGGADISVIPDVLRR